MCYADIIGVKTRVFWLGYCEYLRVLNCAHDRSHMFSKYFCVIFTSGLLNWSIIMKNKSRIIWKLWLFFFVAIFSSYGFYKYAFYSTTKPSSFKILDSIVWLLGCRWCKHWTQAFLPALICPLTHLILTPLSLNRKMCQSLGWVLSCFTVS